MTVSKILAKLVGRLLERLPLSILSKLADGKLSKEELNDLKEEIILIVTSVLSDIYNASAK